jgi:hypothetical protein
MVQNALSAANAGPCSIVKKMSERIASWGVAPTMEPSRGPSHSAAAVPPRTKKADAAIFAASSVRADGSISGLGETGGPRSSGARRHRAQLP